MKKQTKKQQLKKEEKCRFSLEEDCILTRYNLYYSIPCNGLSQKKGCPIWKYKK